jgi:enoyl-CoA hydratase/carnithine racemase
MKETLVKIKKENGIAWLELHAPPANTYSYEMMRELDEAILDVRMDDTVHVIVLIGNGEKFFCAGADISMLNQADPKFKYYFCLHANETLNRLEQTPKLVLAALNGHTVGGGLEIALAADLRIAAEGAGKIGLPEVTLGVLPGTGGTQRLARALGKAKALEWMISGRNVDFQEAGKLGLIQKILPRENFREAVAGYAADFVPPAKASKAVGAIKRAVQSGLEVGFHEGLAIERELQQQLFISEDAKEGILAFGEKRAPDFKGE